MCPASNLNCKCSHFSIIHTHTHIILKATLFSSFIKFIWFHSFIRDSNWKWKVIHIHLIYWFGRFCFSVALWAEDSDWCVDSSLASHYVHKLKPSPWKAGQTFDFLFFRPFFSLSPLCVLFQTILACLIYSKVREQKYRRFIVLLVLAHSFCQFTSVSLLSKNYCHTSNHPSYKWIIRESWDTRGDCTHNPDNMYLCVCVCIGRQWLIIKRISMWIYVSSAQIESLTSLLWSWPFYRPRENV